MATDSILGRMYAQHRSQTSNSGIYKTTPQAPARQDLYAGSHSYQGLGSYDRTVADPLAKKPGESQEAWERRTAVHRRAAEQAAQAEAEQRTWDEHRAQVDNHVGTGTGILGNAAPQSRSAIIGGRGFSEPGTGQAPAMGHIRPESLAAKTPLSAADVNVIIAQREAERRGPQPARQDVRSLRSTGDGIL